VRVLTVDEIRRSTLIAWRLELDTRAQRRAQLGDEDDVVACSRTARAELYRYNDPGHPEHGTWSFQLIDRPWPSPLVEDRSPEWLQHADALTPFPTWRACFDAAVAAVRWARGCA
jgi:hypothetical protein